MPETKNNHYIPQFYLSMWTDPIKKQTFCLNKKTQHIFQSNTRNLCADRIWNDNVEKRFSKLEEKYWKPVLEKVLRTEKVDLLSSAEREHLFSFIIALKTRRKNIVDNLRKDVDTKQKELEKKWLKYGIATQEDIIYLRTKDSEIDSRIFPNVYAPKNLFNNQTENWRMNQLKYFNLGIKKSRIKNISLVTSENPVIFFIFPNTKHVATQLLFPLSPNILLFGTRGIPLFMEMYNQSADSLFSLYNTKITTQSNFIISREKSQLEYYKNHKKTTVTHSP